MFDYLTDYDVISILQNDSNSTGYKVKHKINQKVFVCRAFDYEDLHDDARSKLFEEIDARKRLQHENLMHFEEHFHHAGTQTVYLLTEHCHNGNLIGIIDKCRKENKYIHEDFVWYFLCKMATILKEFPHADISVDNIHLDKHFQIKLLFLRSHKLKQTQLYSLAETALNICLLQKDLIDVSQSLTALPDYYSKELKATLKFVSKAETIDSILHHPAFILRSALPQKDFFKLVSIGDANQKEGIIDDGKTYLDNLRNRERVLKIKEQHCYEQICNLRKRELKVAVMERQAEETIQKAQLYLKRTRASVLKKAKQPKQDVDCSNSTYASCGEVSFIKSTSCKLNKENLIRKTPEKHISFKGHSPLKQLHNTISETQSIKKHKKLKKRFSIFSDPLNKGAAKKEDFEDVRPISWNEDTKKQAFDLLRMMNKQCNIKDNTNVKHTYL